MKTTKLLLAFLLAFSLLIGGVSALGSCALSDPSTNVGNCITGSSNTLTATCSGLATGENVTNISLNYRNTTTGTWYVVETNETFNETSYTFTFNSQTYAESASAYLNVTYNINGTNSSTEYSALYGSTIEVDHSAPTTPIFTQKPLAKKRGVHQVECSSSDTVDTSITYSQVLDPPTLSNGSAQASSTAKYLKDEFMIAGSYWTYCTVTDNCANSSSARQELQVRNGDDPIIEVLPQIMGQPQADKDNMTLVLTLIGVFVVLILIVLVVYVTRKKD